MSFQHFCHDDLYVIFHLRSSILCDFLYKLSWAPIICWFCDQFLMYLTYLPLDSHHWNRIHHQLLLIPLWIKHLSPPATWFFQTKLAGNLHLLKWSSVSLIIQRLHKTYLSQFPLHLLIVFSSFSSFPKFRVIQPLSGSGQHEPPHWLTACSSSVRLPTQPWPLTFDFPSDMFETLVMFYWFIDIQVDMKNNVQTVNKSNWRFTIL